jgi:hypothetical protein
MTLTEVVAGAAQLSTLALDAASVSDPGMTASRVTDLAVKLIPCVAVDVVRVTAVGDLRILASSDPGLSELSCRRGICGRTFRYPTRCRGRAV